MPLKPYSQALDRLYAKYNRRQYVHPDPLEFLFDYEDPRDREIVALIASSLAYGRVAQILRSVSLVLERMGATPGHFLRDASGSRLRREFADFKHRFATGEHLGALLCGIKRLLQRYGSIESCFAANVRTSDVTVQPVLTRFVEQLSGAGGGRCGHLLPGPARGSACKRLHLFLRWMVRRDEVDPGGWDAVPASMLIVPLDVHMHRIALVLGATRRKGADIRTAVEITDAFRAVSPDDPVRYDFALTRFGIRPDMDLGDFLRECGAPTMAYD